MDVKCKLLALGRPFHNGFNEYNICESPIIQLIRNSEGRREAPVFFYAEGVYNKVGVLRDVTNELDAKNEPWMYGTISLNTHSKYYDKFIKAKPSAAFTYSHENKLGVTYKIHLHSVYLFIQNSFLEKDIPTLEECMSDTQIKTCGHEPGQTPIGGYVICKHCGDNLREF